MSVLTIDAMSAESLERLKELASRQGKTQAALAAELLDGILQTDARSRAALAQRIRSLTPKHVRQTDSTEIVRSLRDE
jgi:predicted DNA-binding protein